jgi:4-phospho-D-threonate 3-dehydrogenase / 4-phospho-D-erythronate 3-dehydrogenase
VPGRAAGVVTGPISKQAWQLAGHGEFPGHTELFAARFGVERFGMMFVSPRLRTILATTHIPLMAVGSALTVARVLETIELGFAACVEMGLERPRIAVCGLNPHAGEGGLLGAEDGEVIAPAIAAARESGIDARGPFPGDTIFNAAVQGVFDLVVAMYHDQGLIPIKLLERDRAVNVTVGLPVVRTSPDHGTAFDIAGQNRADPGSMKAALALAAQMAGVRGLAAALKDQAKR